MTGGDLMFLGVGALGALCAVGAAVHMLTWTSRPVGPSVRRLRACLRADPVGMEKEPFGEFLRWGALSDEMVAEIAEAEGYRRREPQGRGGSRGFIYIGPPVDDGGDDE